MNTDLDLARNHAMALTTRDRLALADQLWESVVTNGDTTPLDRETIELAHARDRELEDGTVTAISMEEMMTRSGL